MRIIRPGIIVPACTRPAARPTGSAPIRPAGRRIRSSGIRRNSPSDWEAKFKAYVDRFGYGNRDVSGNPGKHDGLTQSWLLSSLTISADEQVAFLRRMLAHRLVSARAHVQAEAVIPVFAGHGGWQVRGKTGTGWMTDAAGEADRTRPLGWFVGWANKAGRRVVFARLQAGPGMPLDKGAGMTARAEMLAAIGGLAR